MQHFVYDSISIDLMIKIGLINVMVERLDMYTRDMANEHTKETELLVNTKIKTVDSIEPSKLTMISSFVMNSPDKYGVRNTVAPSHEQNTAKRVKIFVDDTLVSKVT